jgi:ATP-dependent Clp protease ATP-binding subunit ClpC
MSEFMEPHSVSKLIGSPPGYIGYDDAGQLTEYVRRNPYSVILFDEIEKAHPDVFNVLLQILEEGNLTDTHGRRVDFRDTIIIMTSNIGARELQKSGKVGFSESQIRREESKKEKALEALKKHFNPEFLNRIDEVIVFHSLTKDQIKSIIDIMVNRLNNYLFDKKIRVELDDLAKEHFCEKGYDEKYGARPLRRLIQKEVEDYLANRFLEGAYKEPTQIFISYNKKEEKLKFEEKEWDEYDKIFKEKQIEREKKEKEKKEKGSKIILKKIKIEDTDPEPANSGQLT